MRIDPHGEWTTDLDVVTAAGMPHGYVRPKYERGQKGARLNMGRSLERWLGDSPRLESDSDSLKATYRAKSRRSGGASPLCHLWPGAAAACLPPVCPGPRPCSAAIASGRARRRCSRWSFRGVATLLALGGWQGSWRTTSATRTLAASSTRCATAELTAFEERPHSLYYGAADVTPLFVVLLDEYERWSGDRRLVRESSSAGAGGAQLDRRAADLQGNGYTYQRRNEQTGLENQCWKDSGT